MAQGTILVLDKTLRLLTEMAPDRGVQSYGVVELANKAGLPVSTTHRLLQVLKNHGFVSQTDDKRYHLGYRLMELGMMVWRTIDVRSLARRHMERLAMELEETIYLTLPDGHEGVHIDKVESPLNLRITEPIGMRLPLYQGASRLAMLAYMEPSVIDAVISDGLERGDAIDQSALRSTLDQVRATGFAITVGVVTRGTAGVAVPVADLWGQPIASLSAAGPDWRYPDDRVPAIAAALKKAAEAIQAEMGMSSVREKGESLSRTP